MGTNCAPLVADLFLFYYERDFMLSLSEDYQSDVIEAFNFTSRYDLLHINNNFLDSMVNRIYPAELQLKRPTCQITRPRFFIYIYLYRMVLSKFSDKDIDIIKFVTVGKKSLRNCFQNFIGGILT